MNIFILGVLLLAASEGKVIQQKEGKATGPCYTTTYNQYNSQGLSYTFVDYVADLSLYSFNNEICSVHQTGLWMYYENVNYNDVFSGRIHWVHGIEFSNNFPLNFCGITTSLKFGGNRYTWNEDSYTLYEGEYMTGAEFYGNIPTTSLGILNNQGSSLVLTGLSPWTFYSGLGYTGAAYCFYPTTDQDVYFDGSVLDFGIYVSLPSLGVPDNIFNSVRKGCFSSNVIKAEQLQAVERTKNGAWGTIDL